MHFQSTEHRKSEDLMFLERPEYHTQKKMSFHVTNDFILYFFQSS